MDAQQLLRLFCGDVAPQPETLVASDGFDEFEKGDALRTYAGKDAQTILCQLRDGSLGNGFTALEELDVLEPVALLYYLGPFLARLSEVTGHPLENDELVANVLYRLSEVLRRYGFRLFSPEQQTALRQLLSEVTKQVSSKTEWPWRHDILRYAGIGLALLNGNSEDGMA